MKQLPLRPAVRVIVTKGERICLCKQTDNGKFACYAFPGGGIEAHQDHHAAVKAECLEEVGINVTNIVSLNLIDERHGVQNFWGDWAKKYSGSKDFYYIAQYLNEDRRLFNTHGDGYEYEWLTIPEAVHRIKHGPESEFNAMRIKALDLASQHLSNKNPAKSYLW
jgi:ADP-ribose pyrophosphatase YjhB (NUDIX family)